MVDNNAIELYALRGNKIRPASDEEKKTAKALYAKGHGDNANKGILFIHGFTVSPANFYDYAQAFIAQGFAVSLPMLPGHGSNPADLKEVTREQWLQTVLTEYDKLKEKSDDVYVVGISLGASLALQLAVQRKTIRKLFLLAPAVYPLAILTLAKMFLVPIMDFLGLDYWMHVAGDVKKADGFELGYKKTPIHGLKELYETMSETQDILEKVDTPTLIIQGKVDHEVPADKAQEVYDKLGTKEKELLWLDNSFHEIPRDHDAQLVLEKIFSEIR